MTMSMSFYGDLYLWQRQHGMYSDNRVDLTRYTIPNFHKCSNYFQNYRKGVQGVIYKPSPVCTCWHTYVSPGVVLTRG